MIKVEKITLKEFRGIRELELNMKGANFAVAGPNGTGKSGVVDGLEFGLTGSISRLTGQGRGELSIKDHAPHVDSRSHPERAEVILDVVIPPLGGKKARIVRTVKSPSNPKITPNDPDIAAVLKRIEEHPEFVLSRREIIKYVLAEPGARSKELQALLQLNDIEATRAALVKIANASRKELQPLTTGRTASRDNLLRALGISDPSVEAILAVANARRATLSLPPLSKLEATTSIRDGLDGGGPAAPSKVVKATAKADILATEESIGVFDAATFQESVGAAGAALAKLQANEAALADVSRDTLLEKALELYDSERCPVCETPWEPDAFKKMVAKQREKLAAIVQERKNAEKLLEPTVEALETAVQRLTIAAKYGPLLPTPIDVANLAACAKTLGAAAARLRAFLPLNQTIETLKAKPSGEATAIITAIKNAVDAIPEPTERDAARDYLIVGQERLEAYRVAASGHARVARQSAVADKAVEVFAKATDAALDAIYQSVEHEFREFYRSINSDDEEAFEAQLTPSMGKLGFAVDFYGRGFFPPGAYHSEGHQDAMGLCLYLALMKHLLADGFTFAVLDDVLMSVDTGHRREVCTLLKSVFPNTQFVLTTHDGVWMRLMKSVGLVGAKSSIEFRRWDVDHGPSEWTDANVWEEISGALDKNDVRTAAGALRHHLEHLAGEYCGNIGARVEFRGDGRYELGDLLPSAVGMMNALYKEAKSAANSWGNADLVKAIGEREGLFGAAAKAALGEQWQINPAIHYNEWANFSKQDFAPVVETFKALVAQFSCPKCDGPLYLVKNNQKRDSLRCACGAQMFSLVSKPK
ncbi:MAG TPA: ATP-binding protein [Rhizomicrobium sp.]|nr:ATP-binding protein [Rhizomicrobium sp.]